MKNMKKIIVSAVIGLPLLFSQEAFAEHYRGSSRSNHYQRGHSHVRPNNAVGPRTTYTTRHGVHRPRVVHQHMHPRPVVRHRYVHYRPYYRPMIAHYHYGAFDPCYDDFHSTGVYWNVNVGSGGLGIGIQSGW
jgi:hypothetical protein